MSGDSDASACNSSGGHRSGGTGAVCAGGCGDQRPGRTNEEFEHYLTQLRDPLIAEIVANLEPDGDVAIHRQTANRRLDYGSDPDWPAGLLVVGDAMCAFNPIYGQGITVAAMQAELLRTALPTSPSRQIQRKLSALVDLPFLALFIAAVWLLGGWVALVPALAVPLVLGAGLLVQVPIGQTARASQRDAARRHGLLVEP